MDQLLTAIEQAAHGAGEIMLRAGDERVHAESKGGHANFVTEYDREVQDYLFRQLSALLPEARFIGEENGADRVTEAERHGFAFCVDPIDGTSNFLTGYRPSVTSIALLRDGAPYLGVVYEPYRGLMFTARLGGGSFLNGRPIHSSEAPLSRSLVGFGTSPYLPEMTERTIALYRFYLPRCIDLRRSGSAAWDLCSVAMGTTGLFYELQLSLWDYAAAALIAAEAGCTATDLTGQSLRYDGPTSILCASAGVSREAYMPDTALLN